MAPSPSQQSPSTASPTSAAHLKTQKLYALCIATVPGIYKSWTQAKPLIDGCAGAKYKGFNGLDEAMAYIRDQFSAATFTIDAVGNHIVDDPSEILKVVGILTKGG